MNSNFDFLRFPLTTIKNSVKTKPVTPEELRKATTLVKKIDLDEVSSGSSGSDPFEYTNETLCLWNINKDGKEVANVTDAFTDDFQKAVFETKQSQVSKETVFYKQ